MRKFEEWFNLQEEMRGEYWITDSGDVYFADGDVGDWNHEGYVLDQLHRNIASHFDIEVDHQFVDWEEVKRKIIDEILDSMDADEREEAKEMIEDYDIDSLILPRLKDGFANAEVAWDVADGGGDAREFSMEYWGWKRVQGDNVETWTFTPNDMQVIGAGIGEILSQEGYDDSIPDDQIVVYVYVYSNKASHEVTLEQLKRGSLTAPSTGDEVGMNYRQQVSDKQVRDMELQGMHPAYLPKDKNPYGRNVSPFGDHKISLGVILKE